MTSTYSGEEMSPSYVQRKKKPTQSHSNSAETCSALSIPEETHDQHTEENVEKDASHQHDTLKTERIAERKSYENLQSVSIPTVGYPITSCGMASGGLVNGSDPDSKAQPTARPPPTLEVKDVWSEAPESSRGQSQPQDQSWSRESWIANRDQVWISGRDRTGQLVQPQTWGPQRHHSGLNHTWISRQEHGTVQGWARGDRVPEESWNRGRDPEGVRPLLGVVQSWGPRRGQEETWGDPEDDRGNVWRPDLNMKKAEREDLKAGQEGSNFSLPPKDRNSGATHPDDTPMSQADQDQKPPVLLNRKEPPTYPAGSEEERWQLQIVAKGRVACPKCKSVSRKTVEGLKKHMENCRLQPFTCQHCGKQLRSSTGMKYHVMADHSHLPSAEDAKGLDDRTIKEKLRKILKRLGKLKCSREGCNAAFTSIMGYVYHMKKCGKEESELEKMLLNCSHCGKTYRSKAGLEYHLRSEHAPSPQRCEEDEILTTQKEVDPERTASGRVQRASAQVANFHLAEIANNDLPKDWPKRKFQSDLVPDDTKLKYARPGLPAFSQEVLRKWKNEVKLQRKVHCPNQGCSCTYTSVSGLKAHLGLCTRGEFEAGKYKCLICSKEFNSESGVKYHINSVHSQDWFVTNKKACKKFEKMLRIQPKSGDVAHPSVPHPQRQQQTPPHLHHPLHHLPQQSPLLHAEQQNLANAPMLQYISLEPPSWVDMEPREAGRTLTCMTETSRDMVGHRGFCSLIEQHIQTDP